MGEGDAPSTGVQLYLLQLVSGRYAVTQHYKYEREPRFADHMAMSCLVHYSSALQGMAGEISSYRVAKLC